MKFLGSGVGMSIYELSFIVNFYIKNELLAQ